MLTWHIGGIEADPASWADIPVPQAEPAVVVETPKRRRGTHPRANSKTQAIVDYLRESGGRTCQQIAAATGQPRHNTRSRLYELKVQGRVLNQNGRWLFNRFAPKAVRDA